MMRIQLNEKFFGIIDDNFMGGRRSRQFTHEELENLTFSPCDEKGYKGYYDFWKFSLDGIEPYRVQPVVAFRDLAAALAREGEIPFLMAVMTCVMELAESYNEEKEEKNAADLLRNDETKRRQELRRQTAFAGPWGDWVVSHPPVENEEEDEEAGFGWKWDRSPAEMRGWERMNIVESWIRATEDVPPPWPAPRDPSTEEEDDS